VNSPSSFAAIVSMALLLGACSRQEHPAPAAPVAPAGTAAVKSALSAEDQLEQDLMRAVFGAHYRPADDAALATLIDEENRSTRSAYYVTAASHKILASGDVVLVANAIGSSQNPDDQALKKIEEPDIGRGNPGLLNVFILRPQAGGGWKVVTRHENVATIGSSGHIGSVEYPMLGKDKPGLAIVDFYTGQGYSISALSLFDLSDPALREVSAEDNRLHSDNEGACDPETTEECWSVQGKWRFEPGAAKARPYDDLVIDFSGEKSTLKQEEKAEETEEAGEAEAPEGTPPAVPAARSKSTVASTARYVFDGKRYRLAQGDNPVPDV
jgi:hypothetical protein